MAGEQGFTLHEIGWPEHVKVYFTSLVAKWTHFVLWDKARHDRRSVLGPEYSAEAIAMKVGSGVKPEEISGALDELVDRGLIEVCPCGSIWLKDVRAHHLKTKWKDVPQGALEFEPLRISSNDNEPRCWCRCGVGIGEGEGGDSSSPDEPPMRVDHAGWLAWWNKLAPSLGLSTIRNMTDKRRRFLRQKVKTEPFLDRDDLEAAIREQPFLHGENDRGWMVTFDSLIERQGQAQRIIERGYGSKKRSSKPRKVDMS